MFGRNTLWRQGSVLTPESVSELSLTSKQDALVVLISHDCDLANDRENFAEAIVGQIVSKVDGNYANGRNARKLHLCLTTNSQAALCVELKHGQRVQVAKEKISKIGVPYAVVCIQGDEKRVLKHWLASRYGRPAFPTEFEDRLRNAKVGRDNIHSSLGAMVAKNSEDIVAIFFDLGDARNRELPVGEPYLLSVFVIYKAEALSRGVRDVANSLCKSIQNLFETACGNAANSVTVALEDCWAVSDQDFSLAQIRRMDQWRLEHRSFGDPATKDDVVTSVPS